MPSMGGLEKTLVAVVLGGLEIIDYVFGTDWFGRAGEEYVGVVISALIPILIWLTPNRS